MSRQDKDLNILFCQKKNGEPYYTPFKNANEHIFVLTDTAYF